MKTVKTLKLEGNIHANFKTNDKMLKKGSTARCTNEESTTKHELNTNSLINNKKSRVMPIVEEQKKKRAQNAIKVQQAKQQMENERIKRLEVQYQSKMNMITKQRERQHLAMNAEIQRKRFLAEKRANDNEVRRQNYLTQRKEHLQALKDDKSYGVLRKKEQDQVNRLDEIRLQEIRATYAKLQKQYTNLNRPNNTLNYNKYL